MNYEELVELRHDLHKHPELSGSEIDTAVRLEEFLAKRRPDELITEVGGYGIIAVYDGIKPGRTVMLRCDIDAIPVKETGKDLAYSSTVEGVSHKCGHDGHMTIMLGVADQLFRNKLDSGRVILLFQPAEETGQGAIRVLSDIKFKIFQIDFVFALHNLPGFPLGSVISRNGAFTSASRGLVIDLVGVGSHAGEPYNGISPAPAVAELILEFQKVSNYYDGVFVTLVHSVIGEVTFGTSPDKALVLVTLRAPSKNQIESFSSKIITLIDQIVQRHHLQCSTEWVEAFPATINSEEANGILQQASKDLDIKYIPQSTPFAWSEDFGHFTSRYSGALFGLGAGLETEALHNPAYDFPDELIQTGVNIFSSLIQKATKL